MRVFALYASFQEFVLYQEFCLWKIGTESFYLDRPVGHIFVGKKPYIHIALKAIPSFLFI